MSSGAADVVVSVIVPCYNSERTIRACLKAILNQRTAIPYDVIVVDSSSDHTPQIVQSEFPSIRLIHLDKRVLAGAARNLGIQATRAPFCLMIDSDCIAEPDVIDRMIARHREARYAAVGGSLANGTPRSLSGFTGYLIEFREFTTSAPMRLVTSVPTANVTYRREVFERLGYFDEDVWPGEDILFNFKLCNSGERILFDPAISVVHLNRTGWRQVLSHQMRLGEPSAPDRNRGALPGRMLFRFPPLISLMPLVRLARAAVWFVRTDRRMFLKFLVSSPIYFIGACFWSVGFFKTAIREMTV